MYKLLINTQFLPPVGLWSTRSKLALNFNDSLKLWCLMYSHESRVWGDVYRRVACTQTCDIGLYKYRGRTSHNVKLVITFNPVSLIYIFLTRNTSTFYFVVLSVVGPLIRDLNKICLNLLFLLSSSIFIHSI